MKAHGGGGVVAMNDVGIVIVQQCNRRTATKTIITFVEKLKQCTFQMVASYIFGNKYISIKCSGIQRCVYVTFVVKQPAAWVLIGMYLYVWIIL